MDDLKFHEIKFVTKNSLIDDFFNNGIINSSTYALLQLVTKNDGFIAGGFASYFAKYVYLGPTIEREYVTRNISNIMKCYLGDNCLSMSNLEFRKPSWKQTYGDIDVWFKSEQNYNQFLVELNDILPKILVKINPTPGGHGIEYTCFNSGGLNGQVIQIINKFGTPLEILGSFDIYNAMCYIEKNSLFTPDQFDWLVEQSLLHIQNWNQKYIIQRLSKWMKKHEYSRGLTHSSLLILNEHLPEILELIEKKQKTKIDDLNHSNVVTKSTTNFVASDIIEMHPLMKYFTAENILRMSMYYPDEAYNFAMKELYKRTSNTLQNQ